MVLSPALLVSQSRPAWRHHWLGWLGGSADQLVVLHQLGLQHELSAAQAAVIPRLAWGGTARQLQALVSRLVNLLVGLAGEHLTAVTTTQLFSLISLQPMTFLVEFPHVNLVKEEATVPTVHPVRILHLHWDGGRGLQLLLDELDPLLLVQFV